MISAAFKFSSVIYALKGGEGVLILTIFKSYQNCLVQCYDHEIFTLCKAG